MNFLRKAISKFSSTKLSETHRKIRSTENFELFVIEKNDLSFNSLKDKTFSFLLGMKKQKETCNKITFFYNNKFEYKFFSKILFENLKNNLKNTDNLNILNLKITEKQVCQSEIFFDYSFSGRISHNNCAYHIKYVKNKIYDSYCLQVIAKALNYLIKNNLVIRNLCLDNIKITYDGLCKLGNVENIEKLTKSNLNVLKTEFSSLCRELIDEEKELENFEIEENILCILSEKIQEKENLSISFKIRLIKELDFQNINAPLKNKLLLLFLEELVRPKSLKEEKFSTKQKKEVRSVSNEIIKSCVKEKTINENLCPKKVMLYAIFALKSENLPDYLEILFSLKDSEIINTIFSEHKYFVNYKVEFPIIVIDTLFELKKEKKYKKSAEIFMTKIFKNLHNEKESHFLNKITSKTFAFEIMQNYLFKMIKEEENENFKIFIRKSDKEIKGLKRKELAFITKGTKKALKCFQRILLLLLNDSAYFYKSLICLNYAYAFLSDRSLIIDVLPLLCKNLMDKQEIIFYLIEKICKHIEYKRYAPATKQDAPSPLSLIVGNTESCYEDEEKNFSRVGDIDEESTVSIQEIKSIIKDQEKTNNREAIFADDSDEISL